MGIPVVVAVVSFVIIIRWVVVLMNSYRPSQIGNDQNRSDSWIVVVEEGRRHVLAQVRSDVGIFRGFALC